MADDNSVVAVIKSLTQYTERLLKKVTLDVTANLIEDTPVDTGWARSNWVPKIGSAAEGDEGFDHSYNNRKGKIQAIAGQSALQGSGIASVSTYKLGEGSIFITNNVPYIVDLNEGTSKQAPRAFVEAAIARAVEQNANATQGSTE